MHKEIRIADESRGIVQTTLIDERWYSKICEDPDTGNREVVYRPSVTFIVSYYPKGPGYLQWVKQNGEESDQIARLAADRGYKVHLAVAVLNQGGAVKGISCGNHKADEFLNPTTGKEEELTCEEYAGVLSYIDWWFTEGERFFRIVGSEFVTWPDPMELSETTGYPDIAFAFAGTVDLKVEQIATREEIVASGYKGWTHEKGSTGIIDMKTSKDIWPSHKMQGAAYAFSEKADWAATLQLNYTKNKIKFWKFTLIEIRHWFRLFMSTKNIWSEENESVEPKQREYPLEVSLKRKVGGPLTPEEIDGESPKKRRGKPA